MVDVGNFHWIIQWGCFSCQAWINKRRLRLLNWKDIKSWLVGGAITILKNMSSSMERMTSHIWNGTSKIPWFQSPPTSTAAYQHGSPSVLLHPNLPLGTGEPWKATPAGENMFQAPKAWYTNCDPRCLRLKSKFSSSIPCLAVWCTALQVGEAVGAHWTTKKKGVNQDLSRNPQAKPIERMIHSGAFNARQ